MRIANPNSEQAAALSGHKATDEVGEPAVRVLRKAKSLAERELLVAVREGGDRRAVQLHVTLAGGRVLRQAPTPLAGVLPQALASLDARTLARLDRDLAALIKVLHTDERDANIPLGQSTYVADKHGI